MSIRHSDKLFSMRNDSLNIREYKTYKSEHTQVVSCAYCYRLLFPFSVSVFVLFLFFSLPFHYYLNCCIFSFLYVGYLPETTPSINPLQVLGLYVQIAK